MKKFLILISLWGYVIADQGHQKFWYRDAEGRLVSYIMRQEQTVSLDAVLINRLVRGLIFHDLITVLQRLGVISIENE